MISNMIQGIEVKCLTGSNKPDAADIQEKEEDEDLKKEEKKTKARLRTRGPYRKAHANW
jgi:hypothetical protein